MLLDAAMPMTSRLIVCERKGIWAARMRAHLPPRLVLRETRSLAECRAELAQAPASFVVVESTAANLADVARLLADAGRDFPLARCAAVAQRALQSYEGLLREAGAVHFATSPRTAGVMAHIASRHLEQLPTPRTSFVAQIWESLPWHEAATT